MTEPSIVRRCLNCRHALEHVGAPAHCAWCRGRADRPGWELDMPPKEVGENESEA